MLELFTFGAAVAVVLAVVFLIALLAALVWLLSIPFQLLGGLLELAGWLIAAPFLLLAGIAALAFFGIGALFVIPALVVPVLPALLVIAFFVWLVRRSRRGASVRAH